MLFKQAAIAWLSLSPSLPWASATRKYQIENSMSELKNAVYFVNWGVYGRNYKPAQLPVSQITHALYAFANLQSTGEVYSSDEYADIQQHYDGDSWNDVGNNVYGAVKQLYLHKKKNRNLKVLLSIGGWTYSQNGNFASAVSSDANRATFAKTSVALMKDWGFDGIDVDWEYPKDDAEATNSVLLLKAIRSELNSYSNLYGNGYHFLLTVASPAGPQDYNHQKLKDMADVLDFINLMAYDYAGSWDATAGHQTNLYPNPANNASTPFSTDRAVTDYLNAGVPGTKLMLGMPVYGRAFQNTDGPGKPYNGVGSGSWEQGIWDYKALPRPDSTEQYDSVADATYSYDSNSRTMVTYDTVDMVRKKVDYLKSKGLAGSMFWEASGDRNDSGSLIGASYSALGSLDSSQNQLSYPDSQYANLAAGMPNN
ncbi:chitinase [Ustulina deusta]|nr:chitinase [Ustulina deusta]